MATAQSSLLDYWVTIYRRRFALMVIVLSSVITAVYMSSVLEPVYEARASFYLPSDVATTSFISTTSSSGMSGKAVSSPLSDDDIYKPYIGILKSRRVAEDVHALFPSKTVEKLLRFDLDFELSDELIVNVYSRDTNPKLAADVANAYVKALERVLQEGSDALVSDSLRVVRDRLKVATVQRKEAEKALEAFEERNRLPALGQELQLRTASLASYRTRLADARIAGLANQRELEALRQRLLAEGAMLPAAQFLVTTPLIEDIRRRLSALVGQAEAMQMTLGEGHSDVVRMQSESAALQRQLEDEIRTVMKSDVKPANAYVEALRRKLADHVLMQERLVVERNAIASVIDTLLKEQEMFATTKMEWSRLSGAIERARRLESSLLLSLDEFELQAERRAEVIVSLEYASPPLKPSFPILWLNAVVAVLGGFVVGFLYCFLLGYLEATASLGVSRLAREIAR